MKKDIDIQQLKIAITHDFLITYGGAELVLIELLDMFKNAELVTPVHWLVDNKKLSKVLQNRTLHTSKLQKTPNAFRKLWKFFLPQFATFFEEFDFSEYDLVISNSSSFAKWINTKGKTKHIAYINTPPRFLWGMETTMFHKIHPLIKVLTSRLYKGWQKKDQKYTKAADVLVANSTNIQTKIKEIYKLDSEVIYPPVKLVESTENYRVVSGDYYLIVNRLVSYKNIDKIINAFKASNRKLVVIGSGPEEQNLKNISGANIHFTGFISDKARNEYLAGCKALIYPGTEDFGIGMVEALNFGKPVVAFNEGGSKEILTEATGVLFSGYSEDSIRKALEQIESTDFKPSIIKSRATKFSNTKFRENINKIISGLV